MNRVAARITPELDLDPRLERVQDYLRLLGLDIEAQTRMLAELDRRLGTTRGAATQDRADELFDLVHQLLREHADDRNRTDAADDVASIPARIGTRFGSFGYQPWQGWPRLVSMPAIRRGHMRPPALDRNLLNRLLAALRDRKRPRSSEGARLWRLRFAAKARQLLLLALVAGPAFVATAYLATVLPHQGGTALELAIMVASFALFGWILVGFWNAVAGFRVIFGGDRFALRLRAAATTPLPREVHTAVVMPICHEEVARVFAGMQAVWTSLEATGRSSGFHFFVLSDSSDPDTCVAEEEAWADMCRKQASSGRLFYRRRRTHAKRKNGNIADFCRRWGGNYRYMIVLDADSIMSGDTLVRLVQAMELHPEAGLIQTQPIAVNRISPVARVQQFALRAYGPLFAAGLHFWHLDNAHYWGHNAIIRV
ncbi:MAG: glycosyltransferase, partial [Salinisphaera sp.]|nr:glycosyltransferase [Salinisphaera sp.]